MSSRYVSYNMLELCKKLPDNDYPNPNLRKLIAVAACISRYTVTLKTESSITSVYVYEFPSSMKIPFA